MSNEQIIKEEYILRLTQKQKFNPNGMKVVDENSEPLVLLQTANQKMFFNATIAQNLMKDIALLLAGIAKKEVPKVDEKEKSKNK